MVEWASLLIIICAMDDTEIPMLNAKYVCLCALGMQGSSRILVLMNWYQ